MRIDITPQDCEEIVNKLQYIKKEFSEVVNLLLTHDIAINRMTNAGILRLQHANDLEVVGVAARASGRQIDIRKNQPYAAYDQVQFQVPVFPEGDVLSRIRIRIEEVYQSLSIIEQVLNQLPDGDIQVGIPKLTPYRYAMGWCESPRGETVHWAMIGPNNTVYRYRVRSATYSNWPAVPLTMEGNIVPDFPLINKSFELCYACCDR
jgi:Ni,Fe-hydrogenase III large subunit